MINWKVTAEDAALLRKIVDRAIDAGMCERRNRLNLDMDLTAAHLNGCALDLPKLLAFDDANFGHDVYGISRYIDRETGEIGGFFLPRCALPSAPIAGEVGQ